jgi:hypothetical protein
VTLPLLLLFLLLLLLLPFMLPPHPHQSLLQSISSAVSSFPPQKTSGIFPPFPLASSPPPIVTSSMIGSLFILNDKGSVLFEKHYRRVSSRACCEDFWKMIERKAGEQVCIINLSISSRICLVMPRYPSTIAA